jgi:general secretion pathway protein D
METSRSDTRQCNQTKSTSATEPQIERFFFYSVVIQARERFFLHPFEGMTSANQQARKSVSNCCAVTIFAGICLVSQMAHAQVESVAGIAEREIARRQAMADDALRAIEAGDQLSSEKDFQAAIDEYRDAIKALPESPMNKERRQLAMARYVDAAAEFAREHADNGRYKDARKWISDVLEIDPEHRGALALRRDLDDPEIYSAAHTEEYVEAVDEVEAGLQLAIGHYDLGRFDRAEESLQKVLQHDPYNSAARRMMTKLEQERKHYFRDARAHTRSRMLTEVNAAWETMVPVANIAELVAASNIGGGSPDGTQYVSQKLSSIELPKVHFADVTVEEAIDQLRADSRRYDMMETEPSEKGVNIILKSGVLDENAPRINLDLANVPLAEALRYVTEFAGLKVKIEPYAVLVVPLTDVTDDLYTRVFRVPPDFLSSAGGDDGGGAAAIVDPFAAPAADGGGAAGAITPRKSAKEILEARGVTFPEGSSAFFNPTTSQLIVRNTQGNIDLIDAYVEDLIEGVQRQIHIGTKFVEVTQTNLDELGFDWLLGQFNIGGDKTFGSGGVTGSGAAAFPGDYPFNLPGSGSNAPIGAHPLTKGLRFGNNAVSKDSIDDLIGAASATVEGTQLSPGIFGLAGVFTDPQFQVVIRALSQSKGVDLMTAPNIVTRSGQRAKIEVIREFIYPTEFDPPEIPETFGSVTGTATSQDNLGTVSSFPVTPTTPTAFEMRPVGVTLEVDPVIGNDGFTIDLNLAPEVVEFEGFINYGSPIRSTGVDGAGNAVQVEMTENRIEQPIFATRKVTTAVTIWDGQTVAIGGLMREDVRSIEDKVPILGDIPIVGRLFQTKVEQMFKRNMMIFVSARLIDPAGQPIRSHEELTRGVGDIELEEESPTAP